MMTARGKAVDMTREMAKDIFSRTYRGERPRDGFFEQALAVLGIPSRVLRAIEREGRREELRWSRLFVLTPSGHGVRTR